MSILYIDKSDCVIGKQDNRITVKYKDGMVRTIPVESIDGITLLGCLQQVILKLLFKESRQIYMTNHSH